MIATPSPAAKTGGKETELPDGHIAITTLPSKEAPQMSGSKIMPGGAGSRVTVAPTVEPPKKAKFKTVSDTI